MALPVIVGAALAAGALVKVAKGWLRSETPRHGYCTWCGRDTRHDFHEDGLTWKKTGPIAVLTGGIGTAIAGLVTRNIYRCTECKNLTLPCRMPRCGGMARSTSVYDYERCGKCSDGNNVYAERAAKERSAAEQHKLVELLRQREQRVLDIEAALAALQRERSRDSARIAGLMAHRNELRKENSELRRSLGLSEVRL